MYTVNKRIFIDDFLVMELLFLIVNLFNLVVKIYFDYGNIMIGKKNLKLEGN